MSPLQAVACLVNVAFLVLVLGLLVSAPRPAVAQSAAPKSLCPSVASPALKEAACAATSSGSQFTLLSYSDEIAILIPLPMGSASGIGDCQDRMTGKATVVQVTPAISAAAFLSKAYARSVCSDRNLGCWQKQCPNSGAALSLSEPALNEQELSIAMAEVAGRNQAYVLLTQSGGNRRIVSATRIPIGAARIELWTISGTAGATDVIACPTPGSSEGLERLAELIEGPSIQAGRIFAVCGDLEIWVDAAAGEAVISEAEKAGVVVSRKVMIKSGALPTLRAKAAALDGRYRAVYQIAAYLSCYSPKILEFHSRLGVALGEVKSTVNPLTSSDCK